MVKKAGMILIIVILLIVGFLIVSTITGKATQTTQCSDRVDNDGDGRCDSLENRKPCTDGSIKGDSGCSSRSDTNEASCVVGSTTCGVGECLRSSTCSNDQVICTPGNAITEVCGDGKDNDCNGVIDNGCNPDSCTDSDGGIVYPIRGAVNGYKNTIFYNKTDLCITNITLNEYYCSGVNALNLTKNCVVNGTGSCNSGRCI